MGWAIALHGGAGAPKSLPPEGRTSREAALRHCLEVGVAALKTHKSPLDVVELVVRFYRIIWFKVSERPIFMFLLKIEISITN